MESHVWLAIINPKRRERKMEVDSFLICFFSHISPIMGDWEERKGKIYKNLFASLPSSFPMRNLYNSCVFI